MMTITVWYKGDVDQIIENVRSIKSLKDKVMLIDFVEGGEVKCEAIRIDGDTSIMIGVDEEA